MVVQGNSRRRHATRLHYGHIHDPQWSSLKKQLVAEGVLHRIYPFALARREWRTEMNSWCHRDVNVRALADDMEEHAYWGTRSPLLAASL